MEIVRIKQKCCIKMGVYDIFDKKASYVISIDARIKDSYYIHPRYANCDTDQESDLNVTGIYPFSTNQNTIKLP